MIFVVGNICAGKTTCLNELLRHKAGLEVYSIDDLRIRFGIVDWAGDAECWRWVGDQIIGSTTNKTKFVECSGTGRGFGQLLSKMKASGRFEIKVVKIKVSQKIARERFFSRPKKGIFLENKLNINESIDNINGRLLGLNSDFEIDGNREVGDVVKDFLKVFGIF